MNQSREDFNKDIQQQDVIRCDTCWAPATRWHDGIRHTGPGGFRENAARDDFQHFLAYSNLGDQPDDIREMLWQAYRASWWPDVVNAVKVVVDRSVEDVPEFVELTDDSGRPVEMGQWQYLVGSLWALRIELRPAQRSAVPSERRKAVEDNQQQYQ
ncbi:MAG: hypothetical protein JWL98_1770 [Xanthomonadaceae bacterium]|nr:hypothetical protein [Xanthomonadaceae bacterium]